MLGYPRRGASATGEPPDFTNEWLVEWAQTSRPQRDDPYAAAFRITDVANVIAAEAAVHRESEAAGVARG